MDSHNTTYYILRALASSVAIILLVLCSWILLTQRSSRCGTLTIDIQSFSNRTHPRNTFPAADIKVGANLDEIILSSVPQSLTYTAVEIKEPITLTLRKKRDGSSIGSVTFNVDELVKNGQINLMKTYNLSESDSIRIRVDWSAENLL